MSIKIDNETTFCIKPIKPVKPIKPGDIKPIKPTRGFLIKPTHGFNPGPTLPTLAEDAPILAPVPPILAQETSS